MQTLQIKIKDNALDTVMMLLKNLKKGLVDDISIISTKPSNEGINKKFDPRDYHHVMDVSKEEIDHYLSSSKKEWDKSIDKK